MTDINALAQRYKDGELTGHDLADMMKKEEITKQERRKIVKTAENLKKNVLSERQRLRLEVKEKKAAPKLTKEDRKRKYQPDLDSEREKEKSNFVECLGCRKRGHFLKDCPKLFKNAGSKNDLAGELCFNCGSYEHSLRDCPTPRRPGKLPFASCFICKQSGHISRDCPENANGLYPKGGCCHICLQKTHFARDCPERSEEDIEKARLWKLQKEGLSGACEKGESTSSSHYGPRGGDDIEFSGYEFEEQWQAGDGDAGDDYDDDGDDAHQAKKKKKQKQQKSKSKK